MSEIHDGSLRPEGPYNFTVAPAKAGAHNPVANGAMSKAGFVYILANRRFGTLYIGVTSDLARRIWEHRTGAIDGFTKRHGLKTLVWYEAHDGMRDAIAREKAIKHWCRSWKIRRIEAMNPEWRDLYPEINR